MQTYWKTSYLSQISPLYYKCFGRSPYPIFFRVQFIVVPTNWVFIDIFYVFLIVFAITDDMIVETSLPNVSAILLVAKTLECRYKLRTRAIRSLNIRRDRRPRLSVFNRIFIFSFVGTGVPDCPFSIAFLFSFTQSKKWMWLGIMTYFSIDKCS